VSPRAVMRHVTKVAARWSEAAAGLGTVQG
jgi:hypothetical protein